MKTTDASIDFKRSRPVTGAGSTEDSSCSRTLSLTSFQAMIAYLRVSQCQSSYRGGSSELISIKAIGSRWTLSGTKRFWKTFGGLETLPGRNGSERRQVNDVEMPALRKRPQTKFLQSGNVTVRQLAH